MRSSRGDLGLHSPLRMHPRPAPVRGRTGSEGRMRGISYLPNAESANIMRVIYIVKNLAGGERSSVEEGS